MKKIVVISAMAGVVILAYSNSLSSKEASTIDSFKLWVSEHLETRWTGESELWVDPTGNESQISEATMLVDSEVITYTWQYDDVQQTGELRINDDVLHWKDSWHQPQEVLLSLIPGHGSLFAAEYSYSGGSDLDWHWRIKLAERPDGSIVLQMTNIAPWGEEARAVRTVVRRLE